MICVRGEWFGSVLRAQIHSKLNCKKNCMKNWTECLWDSLSEPHGSLCERRLKRTVLRPALLPFKTAQFTQFFHRVWRHTIKSLSLTECILPFSSSCNTIFLTFFKFYDCICNMYAGYHIIEIMCPWGHGLESELKQMLLRHLGTFVPKLSPVFFHKSAT